MGWDFVACSQKLGTVKGTGPVSHKPFIITVYGEWIREEDAEILVEQAYPAYCPAEHRVTLQHNLVFYTSPSARQMQLKPRE